MVRLIWSEKVIVLVELDGQDDFYDGWIGHGAKVVGITGHGVKFVIVHGETYYDLTLAKILINWRREQTPGIDLNDAIYEFFPGASGDTIKDIYKELGD